MVENIIVNRVTEDLKSIFDEIKKDKLCPPEAYVSFFKEQYAKYNKDRITNVDIRKRYLIETTLLSYFVGIMRKENPQLNISKLVHSFYRIKETNVMADYVHKNNIISIYLIATRILLRKDNKYFCEFYTPSFISSMIIEHIPESAFNNKNNTFLDPSCGVGSILADVLQKAIEKLSNLKAINEFIDLQLHGYDILPFSVSATKLQIATIHQFNFKGADLPTLNNFVLQDTLHCTDDTKFTYILANPPYMKTINNKDIIGKYKDVIMGHPNLYLLFLLWSLDNVEERGRVVFLLPQTLRVGAYNHKFRKLINNKYFLNKITLFYDRTNIFSDVEQRIMIVSFSLRRPTNMIGVTVCTKRNGLISKQEYFKKYDELVREDKHAMLWQLPENIIASELIDKINSNVKYLSECGFSDIGTGSYVWNQHKKDLINSSKNTIPLIYSNNIQNFEIMLPYVFKNKEKKQFSRRLVKNVKLMSKSAVIIKRTTGQESKYKLVAGLFNVNTLRDGTCYYLENHVHYIYAEDADLRKKYKALVCWLNSKLLNWYFASICSTSHISLYEIKTMPINVELMNKMAILAEKYFRTKKEADLDKINKLIYAFFCLTPAEMQSVDSYFNGGKND